MIGLSTLMKGMSKLTALGNTEDIFSKAMATLNEASKGITPNVDTLARLWEQQKKTGKRTGEIIQQQFNKGRNVGDDVNQIIKQDLEDRGGVKKEEDKTKRDEQIEGFTGLDTAKAEKSFGAKVLESLVGDPSKRDGDGEENPYGYGAGTVIGGQYGGGAKGTIGGLLAILGNAHSGGDYNPWEKKEHWEAMRAEEEAEDVNQNISSHTQSDSSSSIYDGGYYKEKDPVQQQSFRDKFAESRDMGTDIFQWTASDGIERDYHTRLDGESDAEWQSFLESRREETNTTASDVINEGDIAENIEFSAANALEENIDPDLEKQKTEAKTLDFGGDFWIAGPKGGVRIMNDYTDHFGLDTPLSKEENLRIRNELMNDPKIKFVDYIKNYKPPTIQEKQPEPTREEQDLAAYKANGFAEVGTNSTQIFDQMRINDYVKNHDMSVEEFFKKYKEGSLKFETMDEKILDMMLRTKMLSGQYMPSGETLFDQMVPPITMKLKPSFTTK